MNIYSNTDALAKALNASWLRGEVISNNIANVDTPGYKRREVAFEGYLAEALKNPNSKRSNKMRELVPKVYTDNAHLSYRLDGNNVDIDTEMAYMAQNQIKYNTLISQVNYDFKRLKNALER